MKMQLLCDLHEQRKDTPWDVAGEYLQSNLGGDPWRVAVASVLLHQSHRPQAEKSLVDILIDWPTPAKLFCADHRDVALACRRCGFQDRRAKVLRNIARAFIDNARMIDLIGVNGVVPYVLDAVNMFCCSEVIA